MFPSRHDPKSTIRLRKNHKAAIMRSSHAYVRTAPRAASWNRCAAYNHLASHQDAAEFAPTGTRLRARYVRTAFRATSGDRCLSPRNP